LLRQEHATRKLFKPLEMLTKENHSVVRGENAIPFRQASQTCKLQKRDFLEGIPERRESRNICGQGDFSIARRSETRSLRSAASATGGIINMGPIFIASRNNNKKEREEKGSAHRGGGTARKFT